MARRRRSASATRSGLLSLPFLVPVPSVRRRKVAARRALSALTGVAVPKPARRTAATRSPSKRLPPTPRTAGRWLRSTHLGAAGSRSYDVYLPAGHRRSVRVPLVMLLHGCNQTAEQFVAATRFTALADRHGFVLVAPRQTRGHQAGGCWRWYESGHQTRGAGEPAVLAGIAAEVLAEPSRWRIDGTRVYAAGISAGGAMALILAATYSDVFAAVGVHSAPAYRSASNGRGAFGAMHGRGTPPAPTPGAGMAPLVVVQGTADPVVYGSNGRLVTEQWLAYDAVRSADVRDGRRITRSRVMTRRSTDGRRYSVTRWYSARGRKRLEHWEVDGLGHAWSGGTADGSYSDPKGPRASTVMWQFFAAHSL
ncbi:PHB depolymerase family esterase [Blastococcus sp. CT_GayMR19]|uniref:extracellular catalytic domain type 1 short-chain-length polyhydroxyalkanoate depolymerase n=1 Tax=Blastococcus sp. CT_GayMR19 TaxID=2559608 RepID=UPI00142FF027|nr:PHB depolymerase family esterase [Blastococcus sp. CT_GayMR19]